jgi:electron transfer flavoprotein beta subunit
MGPPQADAILREAFAMGVDRAILLTDRKFAGADTLATSNALAGALRCIDYDLIITGRQAIDGDTAQVGPQIAEHLDIPQVTYLEDLKVKDNTLIVRKQMEDGYQIVEVDMPCLLSVLSTANQPRYMSVKGIVDCFEKQVEIWTVVNIKVDETKLGLKGSPTKVKQSFAKGMKSKGEVYDVDTEQAVGIIISKLKEKFII